MNPPSNAARSPAETSVLLGWLKTSGLALFPLLVVGGFYFGGVLFQGFSQLPLRGDTSFYVYQLARVGELKGQWWKLGDDLLVGKPYPSAAAKHPGLYEGLDLLLLSSFSARLLDPLVNYHLMVLLVLLLNAWVAAALVSHATGSALWSCIAVLLITLNPSTVLAVSVGHLHLFKYGWVLLAVWAFHRYLEFPSYGRGIWLGLSVAWVLGSSFYYGYFLLLGLGICWLASLAAGSITRRHLLAAGAASAVFVILAAIFTFPVYTVVRHQPLAATYFERDARDVAAFSSLILEYLVYPLSRYASNHLPGRGAFWETWHYPGLTIWLGIAAYSLARLRGWNLYPDQRMLDRLVALVAIFVLLSLAGGPSALLHHWIPSFRCYGRAGRLAVGLASVLAPLLLAGLARQRLPRTITALALLLSFYDAWQAHHLFLRGGPEMPAWVNWLAQQPNDVRLAAFYEVEHQYGAEWDWYGLYYRTLHKHSTLNGCERRLLDADLKRLGATYENLNPEALRFVISQGYTTLAFHSDYLKANSWLTDVSWLRLHRTLKDWSVYQATPQAQAQLVPNGREAPGERRQF